MGACGRALAERGLSLDAVVEQHMALYRSLLAQARRPVPGPVDLESTDSESLG